MFSLRIFAPLLAITTWLVVPAEATTSYYTGASGETSFNAAVGGLTLLNPALTFSAGDLSPGVGLLNASGTGIDFLGFDTAFNLNIPLGFAVSSGKLIATNQAELVQINFPAASVYAFGIHIAVTSSTGNWCIDLTPTGPCAYNVFDSSASDQQFFGFVSNAPVSAPLYIHPLTGNPTIVFTNFEAFGPSEVPEPRTWFLVGLGLITLPLLRRSQRAG
jgi:hypothetical protein